MMSQIDERGLFEQYSRGEITRAELAQRIGHEVLFGDAVLKLYEYGLPLHRPAVDHDSPGVRLVKRLAGQAPRD